MTELPLGITEADLKYPQHPDKTCWDAGDGGRVDLYEIQSRRGTTEWVVATLHISKGRKSDRTYGIRMDGTVCRVGAGPHVLRTVRVHVRESRLEALQPLLELHRRGLTEAGQIRDRIGSRRAEGQLRRAQGEVSWRWSR